MPKRIPRRLPPGSQTRKEQNRDYDVRRADDAHRKLYRTPQWKRLRLFVLDRDPYCKRCEAEHVYKASTVANHIKRARDYPELFFDPDNLEGVCEPCHNSIIQKEERNANGR